MRVQLVSAASLLAMSGAMCFPAAASAQDLPAAAEAPAGAGSAGDITVTGSRIARPELDNAMPVSVVKMDEAFSLGRTSAYDALARDPALGLGQSLASGSTGWDAGISAVNLRNLGNNRSLTLIDGQRRVSASARSSAVDIGMIPVGMIERIEVVTGGAAAIYGADAVTGAVNIITKRNIEGLSLTATHGISSRGDASESMLSGSTGGRFGGGRGSFAVGATYARTASLHYRDRFNPQNQPLYLPNPENTGIDDGIFDNSRLDHYRQIYYSYQPTYFLNDKNWIIEGGVPREAVHDAYFGRGEFALGEGGDGRNLEDQNQLRGSMKSIAAMGRVDYELADWLEYGGSFSYARQKYDGTGPLWRDDSRKTFFGVGGSVAYLDNPYLPDALRDVMVANNLTRLNISRTYGNFPIREEDHDRESWTISQTLGGNLTDKLRWDAFWQYGRTRDDATQGNVPYKSHWLAARDAIADPVTGQPICRSAEARAQGCVPFNIFSLEAPSQQVLDYVMADRNERRVNTQEVFGASLSGGLLALPYGDLGIALGVEHRKEKLRTTDDPLALSGELAYGGGPGSRPELDVGFDVTEIYGEVVVPLLSGLPIADRLEVEGAYRYSDYSTVGATDTWKVGATWAPLPGLSFRAVRSRSVRTPNFGELYEPQVTVQQGSIDDPCEAGAYYASATRAANCRALGVLTPLPDIKVGPLTTTGGNPDLMPETSNSLTLGMVLRPKFIPGFDLTVDYWDIDIRDVITQFSYSRLLYLCVDLPTIDNPYCARSVREGPLGNPVSILSNQVNASRLRARGIDFGASYRREVGPGQLSLSFKGSYLLENVTETTPGIEAGDVVADGGWQNPRFRGTLLTTYDIGKLSVSLDTRFISASTLVLNTDSAEAYPDNTVPSRIYNDLAVQYRVNDKYRIGLGVRNMFDVMPPYMPTTYQNNTMYDVVGRYFYATANVTL